MISLLISLSLWSISIIYFNLSHIQLNFWNPAISSLQCNAVCLIAKVRKMKTSDMYILLKYIFFLEDVEWNLRLVKEQYFLWSTRKHDEGKEDFWALLVKQVAT